MKRLNLILMKAKIIPFVAIISFTSVFFYSCEDTTYKEYKGNVPVYMSYDRVTFCSFRRAKC